MKWDEGLNRTGILLIPHDIIADNKMLKSMAASYAYRGEEAK